MSTIFYSVMGEGRGHAARARAMVERLRDRHRMVLFTSHDALAFLSQQYADDPDVAIHEIPGLKFHYSGDQLDNGKTLREGLGFWAMASHYARQLDVHFEQEKPDLLVCDFEPLVPRAARHHDVLVLSLDHQHFMSTYDLSSLPSRLQRWAGSMSWSIWAFDIGEKRTVVSAFYKPPLRPGHEDVVQVGPLLRPSLSERTASVGPHLLSYLRRSTPPQVIDMLAEQLMPVKLYGLGAREPRGSITFCEINEATFLDDLASCNAVIAAAGNQLLGEALYFGKPFFALPEYNHHEQCINACFLEQLGGGEQQYVEQVTAKELTGFLEHRETYRQNLANSEETYDGTSDAAAAIEAML